MERAGRAAARQTRRAGSEAVASLYVAADLAATAPAEGLCWALLRKLQHALSTAPCAAGEGDAVPPPLGHKRVKALDHQPAVRIHELIKRAAGGKAIV